MPPCGCWELLLHHPWDLPPRTMPSLEYEPGHNVDHTTLARTCQIFRLGCALLRFTKLRELHFTTGNLIYFSDEQLAIMGAS